MGLGTASEQMATRYTATLATLRPCGSDPYRRDDDERSGVSSRSGAGSQKSGLSGRSGASFRSDGSRKGLRTAVG